MEMAFKFVRSFYISDWKRLVGISCASPTSVLIKNCVYKVNTICFADTVLFTVSIIMKNRFNHTFLCHFTNESKAVFKSLIKGLIISELSEQKNPIKFILSK